MIDASDAVVVARAVRKERIDNYSDRIFFKVEQILKGAPPNEVMDPNARFGKPMPSDPNNILSANPEAFRGMCNRYTYRRGDRYVLMLHKDDERGFIVSGNAFSRINEDDFGPGSIWRKAIHTYLEIQQNPDRLAQLTEMKRLVQNGISDDATEFEKQLGADALNHLLNIHPDKPTEWLLHRYEDPDFVMRGINALTVGTPEEDAENLTSLVFGEGPPPEDEKTAILRALSEGEHPAAEPLFRSILEDASPEPTRLGAALSFFIRRGEYGTAKQAFGEHVLWVSAVTGPGSGPGFWGAIWPAIGYSDNLKVETQFAEWWKRQTLASCFLRSDPFDCSYDWDAAAALLDAPRRNQTLILAGASSPKVVAWAEEELDRLAAEGIETFKDDWDFPMKVLLAAYRGDKPKRIHELACGSKSMREGLADLIGKVPTLYTERLLREMMSIEQHEHVREQLLESAVLIAAHDIKTSRWGDADLVYAYARSDGKLAMEKDDERHLPCLE
jgi:hypothetical protein